MGMQMRLCLPRQAAPNGSLSVHRLKLMLLVCMAVRVVIGDVEAGLPHVLTIRSASSVQ